MEQSLFDRLSYQGAMRLASFVLAGLILLAGFGATPRPAWSQEELGACCNYRGSCADVTRETCENDMDGFYFGEGTRCDDVEDSNGNCYLGACCERATPSTPDGSCTSFTTEAECRRHCGYWFQDNQCYQVMGSCNNPLYDPLACDCNTDGEVKINEIMSGVLLALCLYPGPCCVSGYYPCRGCPRVCTRWVNVSPCSAADVNQDGTVRINELIQCVNASFGLCFQ